MELKEYNPTEEASAPLKILLGTLCPQSHLEDYRPPSPLLRSLHSCRAPRGSVGTPWPTCVAAKSRQRLQPGSKGRKVWETLRASAVPTNSLSPDQGGWHHLGPGKPKGGRCPLGGALRRTMLLTARQSLSFCS